MLTGEDYCGSAENQICQPSLHLLRQYLLPYTRPRFGGALF
jgi:hypothetical protein